MGKPFAVALALFFLTSSIDQKYKWVFFISIHNQSIVCLRAKNQALADRIKDLICKNHILLKAGNMSTESPTQPSPNITDGNAFYLYLQQYIYMYLPSCLPFYSQLFDN